MQDSTAISATVNGTEAETAGLSMPETKARPLFRTFTVFTATSDPENCEPDRFCGHGMTIEKVVEWEERIVGLSTKGMSGAERLAYLDRLPDLIVIEDHHVVAVLRVDSDGEYEICDVPAGF